MNGWSLYLIRDAAGRLYTGISTDVARRLAEHAAGRGARALRGRGPLALACHFWRQWGDIAVRIEDDR